MRAATSSGLAQIRSHYDPTTKELFHVLLNATSQTEANFALDILAESIPEKPLVTAVNLREVLASIPLSPFSMRCDEITLMGTAGLVKDRAVMGKTLPDGIELMVTAAGNLVLDVIVRLADEKHYLSPVPATEDFISPALVDLIIQSDYLIDAIVDLLTCMGVVFNPKFYLSVEDWHLEYAKEAVKGLEDLFSGSPNLRMLNLPEV